MGCRISKSEEPTVPVLLCRERCDLILAVSHHRRSLASAHEAYFRSLSRVGDALLQFVQQERSTISSPSTLTLPSSPETKNAKDPKSELPESAFVEKESHLPLSDSGSASPFHSSCASFEPGPGSDAEVDPHCCSGSDCEEITVRENIGFRENPQWHPRVDFTAYPGLVPNMGMGNYQYHFMQSSSTIPTTVYQQPYGDNTNQVYMDYGYGYNYPMYGFKLLPESVRMEQSENPINVESPPPPPPEPAVSGWDFLNPFDSYEQSLGTGFAGHSGFSSGSIRSSPNSSEVREREGIPDLEYETEQESSKGRTKDEVCSSVTGHDETTDVLHEEVCSSVTGRDETIDVVQNVGDSKNVVGPMEGVEPVKPMSDREINVKRNKVKKVMLEEDATLFTENGDDNDAFDVIVQSGTRKVKDVIEEIKVEFGSLVSCGAEVASLLEVRSIPYQSRNKFSRFFLSRILDALLSSATFRTSRRSSAPKLQSTGQLSGTEKFNEVEFNNLSSILDRLYVWEKKLYKEVKEEEKIRLQYEREQKRLKMLDQSGAEASKIDATRRALRNLSTQLNIAMREVEFTAFRIHKLRDDELQPSLATLFQGLMRLWRLIFTSHHKQLQALLESKTDRLIPDKDFETSTPDPTTQLELELLNWSSSFSNWIQAQNSYVLTLNQYLLKWLPQNKEETASMSCSISPMSIGAPPVFVLSNDWAHVAERVSDCNVTDKIQAFALSVHLLQERQDLEMQQKIRADYLSNDLAKRVRLLNSGVILDGDNMLDGKMVTVEGLKKKIDLEKANHKDAANLVQAATTGNLKEGLGPIFRALESFSTEILRSFEDVRFPASSNA